MVIRNFTGTATIILIGILTAAFLMNYYWDDIQRTLFGDSTVVTVFVGNTPFTARVADDQAEREQGLSGSDQLENNEAMLFIFPEPDRYGFWMKDMEYPIDILWFTSDFELVHIAENATPESYPQTFIPPESAQFVLEITAFGADKFGLKEGMEIEIPRSVLPANARPSLQ